MTVWIDTRQDFFAAGQAPGKRGIGAGGEVHAIGFGKLGKCRLAVQRQLGAMRMRDRKQRPRQQNLLVFGQILFPYAHPAATGLERGRDDFRNGDGPGGDR